MKLRIQKSSEGTLLISKLDDEGYISQLIEFSKPLCYTAAQCVLASFEINPERKDVEIEYFLINERMSLADNMMHIARQVYDGSYQEIKPKTEIPFY